MMEPIRAQCFKDFTNMSDKIRMYQNLQNMYGIIKQSINLSEIAHCILSWDQGSS